MKKIFYLMAVLTAAFTVSACRYSDQAIVYPDTMSEQVTAMSLEEAKTIINNAIKNPPAGRRPRHPGFQYMAGTTRIDLYRHNRTGLCLIEAFRGKHCYLEMYVPTRTDGKRFSSAVWRIVKEYNKK